MILIGIKKSKNKYLVKVRVRYCEFGSESYDAMYKALWWAWNNDYDGDKAGKRFVKLFKKNVKQSVKDDLIVYPPVTYKISVVKKGTTWKIKSKSRRIVDIATGNLHEGMDTAISEFTDEVVD